MINKRLDFLKNNNFSCHINLENYISNQSEIYMVGKLYDHICPAHEFVKTKGPLLKFFQPVEIFTAIRDLVDDLMHFEKMGAMHNEVLLKHFLVSLVPGKKSGFFSSDKSTPDVYSLYIRMPSYWVLYSDLIYNYNMLDLEIVSPEVLMGFRATKVEDKQKSTVWAIGTLIYEIIHGKRPFTQPNSILYATKMQKMQLSAELKLAVLIRDTKADYSKLTNPLIRALFEKIFVIEHHNRISLTQLRTGLNQIIDGYNSNPGESPRNNNNTLDVGPPAQNVYNPNNMMRSTSPRTQNNMMSSFQPAMQNNMMSSFQPTMQNNMMSSFQPTMQNNMMQSSSPRQQNNMMNSFQPVMQNNMMQSTNPGMQSNMMQSTNPGMQSSMMNSVNPGNMFQSYSNNNAYTPNQNFNKNTTAEVHGFSVVEAEMIVEEEACPKFEPEGKNATFDDIRAREAMYNKFTEITKTNSYNPLDDLMNDRPLQQYDNFRKQQACKESEKGFKIQKATSELITSGFCDQEKAEQITKLKEQSNQLDGLHGNTLVVKPADIDDLFSDCNSTGEKDLDFDDTDEGPGIGKMMKQMSKPMDINFSSKISNIE